MSSSFASFVEPWRRTLDESDIDRLGEFPDYHLPSDADCLVSTSQPQSFQLGTGASIYTNSLLPAILQAKHEVILVTCFWAESSSREALKTTLELLAEERKRLIAAGANDPDRETPFPLRIRICFSSRSLFQKLFHTSSRDGYVYPPSTWSRQLGLPSSDVLEAGGIELQVKSLFFLPFSVMHPKLLIIDRQKAWLPSCNVSWESWLEGCVEVTGGAVSCLVRFYQSVWDRNSDGDADFHSGEKVNTCSRLSPIGLTSIQSPASRFVQAQSGESDVPTVLLPSSHHRNPGFRPFPWMSSPVPPCTPLNIAILRLLEMAHQSVYIQTPNLTSPPVMDAILEVLRRGVDVTIVTSKNMMMLEQIVTAGTTTSLCLRSLIRRYKAIQAQASQPVIDIEAQMPKPGNLKVSYFHADAENSRNKVVEEPVHSHLKLTVVDGQFTVLGSGNLDRASWFTSQELGILFHSESFTKTVTDSVSNVLEGRTDVLFDSSP